MPSAIAYDALHVVAFRDDINTGKVIEMGANEDILAFAEFAASMAWDQRGNWDDARATYFEDLRSTFGDWGITDQHVIAEAERIFNERADALFGV